MASRQLSPQASCGRGNRSRMFVWAGMARRAGFLLFALVARIGLLPPKAAAQATAPTYTVLYNFTGGSDGWAPEGVLVSDEEANLYGTTYWGGSFACYNYSSPCGVIFKLDPAGNETVLHSFDSTDGANPAAGLVQDAAGNLYGTTEYGTSYCFNGAVGGCGAVFKLDSTGDYTVLYGFTGGPDGGYPTANVIVDASGNLYGTTLSGGTSSCSSGAGCGVVFKLDPSGRETVLHTFGGGKDGANPGGPLMRDPDGRLYGVTLHGGSSGSGVIFELDARGEQYRTLYAFSGGADGALPTGGLVPDADGNLYGVTVNGGNVGGACRNPSGCGAVFKLDRLGNESVLYGFRGGADGAFPRAVTRDAAGNFYGIVEYGGAYDAGAVFKVDDLGHETVLYSFTGGTDGGYPNSGLLLHDGSLYGTAPGGGACGFGVVFRLQ